MEMRVQETTRVSKPFFHYLYILPVDPATNISSHSGHIVSLNFLFKLISRLSLLAFANPRQLRVPPPVAVLVRCRCLLLFLFGIYVINIIS